MTDLIGGFVNLFSNVEALAFTFLAAFVGIVAGALPGLTALNENTNTPPTPTIPGGCGRVVYFGLPTCSTALPLTSLVRQPYPVVGLPSREMTICFPTAAVTVLPLSAVVSSIGWSRPPGVGNRLPLRCWRGDGAVIQPC